MGPTSSDSVPTATLAQVNPGHGGAPCREVVDLITSKRFSVNSESPYPFESELFSGHVLIKLKTDPPSEMYAPYFAQNEKHKFEIQVQGVWRGDDLDASRVFIALEASNPLRLSGVAKLIASLVLRFVHKTNPDGSTGLGDELGNSKAHLAHPLLSGMDRFVVTAPGETPPPMGVDGFAGSLSKEARASQVRTLSRNHTYSFSWESTLADFDKWSAHMPGVPHISLSRVLGDSPIAFVCYALHDAEKPHTQDNKNYLYEFELGPPAL